MTTMALVCDRCAWPTGNGCTCVPVTRARLLELHARHLTSVYLARRNGWAGDARRQAEARRARGVVA